MPKWWKVARHEYLKIARKRSFVISTLGMPLFFVAIIALSVVVIIGNIDRRPLGYVDRSGLLASPILPAQDRGGSELVEVRAFAGEAPARAALEAGAIQAYYVLPNAYAESGQVTLFYWDKPPDDSVQNDFAHFLRANLVADLPASVRERVLNGAELTARSADGRQEISGGGVVNILVPFAIGFFFVFAVMGGAGYLLQAVTDEKENRTIEIMVTSLTPTQLIGGKAIGLIGVALTQIILVVAVLAVGLPIGAQYIEALRDVRLPWSFVLAVVLYFLPAYVLQAGLMIAIGSMVSEVRQGQQVAGIVNLLFTIPYFFTIVFFTNPNSPLAVILTLFPTTSFIALTLRWGLTSIPLWQLIAGWLILALSAVLSVRMAARVFRAGMLRYGQRLDLRAALAAMRAR
jgi:ABC-2 type transport system permease protein